MDELPASDIFWNLFVGTVIHKLGVRLLQQAAFFKALARRPSTLAALGDADLAIFQDGLLVALDVAANGAGEDDSHD